MKQLYTLAISSFILLSAFQSTLQASIAFEGFVSDSIFPVEASIKISSDSDLEFNISGIITNKNNLPLSGIKVVLLNDCDEEIIFFTTRKNGQYRFEKLSKNCCFTIKANSGKSNYRSKIKDNICAKGQLSSKDFLINLSLEKVIKGRQIILSCPDEILN